MYKTYISYKNIQATKKTIYNENRNTLRTGRMVSKEG